MRILLSTIGSRGDVQPLVALALELKGRGQDVHLCVPPDFREWIEGLGMTLTPIGPELRPTGRATPEASPPTPEQLALLRQGTVRGQFETIAAAAEGCDAIVGATALQLATPSIAESKGVPYVFAAFCPAVLPSPHHAPPVLSMLGDAPAPEAPDYAALWAAEARRWNELWGELLNAERASLGLSPVDDVLSYMLTARPWLAADSELAPWPGPNGQAVLQPGAWIMRDERPLSPELEAFLAACEPPVYLGFGSIRAPEGLTDTTIGAARVLGRRVVVSRGWAGLSTEAEAPDVLAIGEVNQQALFPRLAAVVHHGGAGTTTAAARAGAPQVVVPQHYDQHSWAQRVHQLGIGAAHPPGALSPESLTDALESALRPDVVARARAFSASVRCDGAQVAARRLAAVATRDIP